MSKLMENIADEIQKLDSPASLSEKLQKIGELLDQPEISVVLFEASDEIKDIQGFRNKIQDLQIKIAQLDESKTNVWQEIKTQVDVFSRPLNEVVIEKCLSHGIYLDEYTFGKK